MQQVVARGEVGFVADLLVVHDIHHIPVAILPENIGAIDDLAGFALEHDAKFKWRLHFVVDVLHHGSRHGVTVAGGQRQHGWPFGSGSGAETSCNQQGEETRIHVRGFILRGAGGAVGRFENEEID